MDLASPIRSRSPTPLFDRDSFSARNGSVSSVSSHGDAPRGKPYGMRPTLPKPSHLDLDVPSEELQLGDDLKGIPTPFLRDSLRKLGPTLLAACQATTPLLGDQTFDLPAQVHCSLPPSLPAPTHLLAISFRDTQQRMLVPVHSLPLSLSSPYLASLLGLPQEPTDPTLLPIEHLSLPSTASFPLLHDFLHLHCASTLRAALSTLTPLTESSASSVEQSNAALRRAAVLHGLWCNIIELEVGDEGLWDVMQSEWEAMVQLLEGVEGRE